MKTTEEMIAVMQAYVDGKEIEYESYSKWEKVTEPAWNWGGNDYRVKPEPEYIPFTFEDAEFLMGKVVKHKHKHMMLNISTVTDTHVDGYSFVRFLDDFTFLDGSPCGKPK